VSVRQQLRYLLTPTPIQSSSAMMTPENTEEEPDDSEPADGGDIQTLYCSDKFYSPSIGTVTKNYL
jgi:hypothetical protein